MQSSSIGFSKYFLRDLRDSLSNTFLCLDPMTFRCYIFFLFTTFSFICTGNDRKKLTKKHVTYKDCWIHRTGLDLLLGNASYIFYPIILDTSILISRTDWCTPSSNFLFYNKKKCTFSGLIIDNTEILLTNHPNRKITFHWIILGLLVSQCIYYIHLASYIISHFYLNKKQGFIYN